MEMGAPKWTTQKMAALDRYDYSIIESDDETLVVAIEVESDVDVKIADISTEVNSCDGYAYVDHKLIKVDKFQLKKANVSHGHHVQLLLYSHYI